MFVKNDYQDGGGKFSTIQVPNDGQKRVAITKEDLKRAMQFTGIYHVDGVDFDFLALVIFGDGKGGTSDDK